LILFGFFILSSCEKDEIEDTTLPECECFIETAIDTYTYPIRPGSEEWKSFTSSDQMVEVTEVPNAILENMSTIGVYETCAENPLGLDLYLVDSPQRFYDFSVNTFNSWKELISRKDLATTLIDRYSVMCPDCEENNYSSWYGKGGDVQYTFVSIELILAQDAVLKNISKSQCKNLGKIITRNYKYNNTINQSNFFKLFPVWIASRVMVKYDYSDYVKLEAENEQIAIFNQTGMLLQKVGSNYNADKMFKDIMEKFESFLDSEL
jgi:hypothetical protein